MSTYVALLASTVTVTIGEGVSQCTVYCFRTERNVTILSPYASISIFASFMLAVSTSYIYNMPTCYSRSTTYKTSENQHNVVHHRRPVPTDHDRLQRRHSRLWRPKLSGTRRLIRRRRAGRVLRVTRPYTAGARTDAAPSWRRQSTRRVCHQQHQALQQRRSRHR